jgi:ABC-type nickel/cobalt efflux system permease component RcnA
MNRISPFVRGLAIIAVIALAIVVLNQQTSLNTAATLVRLGFYLAMAFAAYLLWRDFGRREIALWPRRPQSVFYGAVALLLVDVGWYFDSSLDGRDLLVFLVVAAVAVYAGFKTWRDQHRYS